MGHRKTMANIHRTKWIMVSSFSYVPGCQSVAYWIWGKAVGLGHLRIPFGLFSLTIPILKNWRKKSGEIHRKFSNTQKPFNHHFYHFPWHVFHCLKNDMFFSQVITVDMKVSIAKNGGPQKVKDGLFHGKSMTIKLPWFFSGCPHDLGNLHMIKWISWGSKGSTVGDQLKTSFEAWVNHEQNTV